LKTAYCRKPEAKRQHCEVYPFRIYVNAGGLVSYGPDKIDPRILKGAKPADLPVMQINKFELVINAQAATMLGLAVPSSLLATADEVIE
jgi:putative ABC transport system substrate-binding protein